LSKEDVSKQAPKGGASTPLAEDLTDSERRYLNFDRFEAVATLLGITVNVEFVDSSAIIFENDYYRYSACVRLLTASRKGSKSIKIAPSIVSVSLKMKNEKEFPHEIPLSYSYWLEIVLSWIRLCQLEIIMLNRSSRDIPKITDAVTTILGVPSLEGSTIRNLAKWSSTQWDYGPHWGEWKKRGGEAVEYRLLISARN
jgi:hypothetical protein